MLKGSGAFAMSFFTVTAALGPGDFTVLAGIE